MLAALSMNAQVVEMNPYKQSCYLLLSLFSLLALASEKDTTSIVVGEDPSIKVVIKGRACNLELANSGQTGEGHAETEYQKGTGFVEFDRTHQTFTFKPKIKYTLNHLSKHIQRVAPYMHAYFPKGSELDFQLKINSLGFGSLNFADINLSGFKLDARYGDVDVNFPTVNSSILRGEAKFHVTIGDLEVENLANLKAEVAIINGGTGQLSVDFGPKLLQDMDAKVDHDVGSTELKCPKGTKVIISGTSRDLSGFGFQKVEKTWEAINASPSSPTLNLKLAGPLGDLNIIWE